MFGFHAVKNVSQSQLITEILARSVAQTWDEARREWSLYEIYEAYEPETCLCGHFPIIELCVLRKRNLTEKQSTKKLQINDRVLRHMRRQR
jgi:hypothetical protein